METQNLGRVKMVWKGAYSSATAYKKDDAVSYEGSSYICIQDATNKVPTNTSYWDVLAEKGQDGADLTERVTTIESEIPSNASSSNKMATASDLTTLTNGVKANTQLIKDTVGWSGKNKLNIPSSVVSVTNIRGVDFTVTRDGAGNVISVKANGTNDNTADSEFNLSMKPLPNGTYILSGGLTYTKKIFYYDGASWYNSRPDEVQFTVNNPSEQNCKIVIGKGQTANNDVFYPMIRDAAILDPSYEPYANKTAVDWSSYAVTGGYNELPNVLKDQTVNTLVCVVNSDDSVTLNGTPSAQTDFYYYGSASPTYDDTPIPSGNYKLSCEGIVAGISFFVIKNDGTIVSYVDNAHPTADLVFDNTLRYRIFIRVASGTALTNKVLKPMISRLSDVPYAPYAMTNKELTESLTNNTLITTGLTFNKCTFSKGGYCKVGSLVHVCMELEATEEITAWTTIVSGIPNSPHIGTPFSVKNNANNNYYQIDAYDTTIRCTGNSISSGNKFVISGTYVNV